MKRLGYSINDVRHIILTHLDLDHAGGLHDFPNAAVHVSGSLSLGLYVWQVAEVGDIYHLFEHCLLIIYSDLLLDV